VCGRAKVTIMCMLQMQCQDKRIFKTGNDIKFNLRATVVDSRYPAKKSRVRKLLVRDLERR